MADPRRSLKNQAIRSSTWLTDSLVNRVLARALTRERSDPIGRRIAMVRYTGRRSGTQRVLATFYARDQSTVWIPVASPELKSWWRQFSEPAPIELVLAGQTHHAIAVAVAGSSEPDAVAAALAMFALGRGDVTKLQRQASVTTMVRVDLSGDS